jgi:hypothetical protein
MACKSKAAAEAMVPVGLLRQNRDEVVKWVARGYMAGHAAHTRWANKHMQRKSMLKCEWVEIEADSGVYNTCQPGEEFHLTEGLELWPYCHLCGRQIEVGSSANGAG